jgi:DNA-binding IclR family transcriptional regulator
VPVVKLTFLVRGEKTEVDMLPKQPNKSLIDGIACLQAVASRSEFIGVGELAQILDMELTKVHRLLRTLAHLGFTQQNKGRKYGPGPAIYALAAQTLYASHFMRDALGPLEELRAKQPHIVAMGVVWNRRVNYLYHAKRGTPLEKAIGTFGNWPAADSGIGLAVMSRFHEAEIRRLYEGRDPAFYENGLDGFLARLVEVRALGHAMVETHSGYHNTTIGLCLKSNPMVGVGVSGRFKPGQTESILEMLHETVDAIDDNAERFAAIPVEQEIKRAI